MRVRGGSFFVFAYYLPCYYAVGFMLEEDREDDTGCRIVVRGVA